MSQMFERSGYVFISSDIRMPIRMPVVALMNRLAEKGNAVTLITNNKAAFDDYRYDYRICRLSFNDPVKGLNTRQEILAYYASKLPTSVFVLTDCARFTVPKDCDVIKNDPLCAPRNHKVIVWELMPFSFLISRRRFADYAAIRRSADSFDAVVSAYDDDALINQYYGQKNAVKIPFLFPFRQDEYSFMPNEGNQIAFIQSAALTYCAQDLMEAFARLKQTKPDATLKLVRENNQTVFTPEEQKTYTAVASLCGVEGSISFAGEGERFKGILSESAFVVVATAQASQSNVTVQLTALKKPFILATGYDSVDEESGIHTVNINTKEALYREMLRLCDAEERKKEVEKLCNLLTAEKFEASIAKWEQVLAAVEQGAAVPDFGVGCDASAFREDRVFSHFTTYLTYANDVADEKKPEAEPGAKQKLVRGVKKKMRYAELNRTGKYTYTQMSPEDVRRSQLLALTMLREFERIAKKHNLTYYVAAGSLLGAARHHGQIPWDDDVDVTLPRKDYNKFIKIAQKELPDTMVLPKNNFPYGFHRMQMKGTNIERTLRQHGMHGVFLDILPLDGAAPTEKAKAKHDKKNHKLISYMFDCARPMPPLNQFRGNERLFIRRAILKVFAPKRLMRRIWIRNAQKYDVDKAAEWVCLPGSYGYEKECFPKEYWGEPYMMEYEHRLCPVMSHWEEYLTLHYGDYKQCPAELEKRTHLLFSIDFGPYKDVPIAELESKAYGYDEKKD